MLSERGCAVADALWTCPTDWKPALACDSQTLLIHWTTPSHPPVEPENGLISQKSHTIPRAWRPKAPVFFSPVVCHRASEEHASACRPSARAKSTWSALFMLGSARLPASDPSLASVCS